MKDWWNELTILQKGFVVTIILMVGGLILTWLAFMTCVTFVDNYEFGFTYDKLTGKIEKIERSGWIVRMPIRYKIHTIDLRPYQVQIGFNQRVLNAKLIRFNPEGLETFIEWHGRDAGDSTNGMLEILKCYAFDREDGRDCPFLSIVSELAPGQGFEATKKATAEK